jgi:hypothetical protein
MHGGKEKCIVFWCRNLKEREHLEDIGLDRRIILKWVLKQGCVWSGLIWLRIGVNCDF